MNFETPNDQTPLDALAKFAQSLPESEGLTNREIREAAQIALNKQEEELTAAEASSPDSELADLLRKALEARHGIPPGPAL